MKLTSNMPKNAIYMVHTAPSVKVAGCVLVHFDRYGVPRGLVSGTGDSKFWFYPDEIWVNQDLHCHMVASHEPDFRNISRGRIKRIIKHWNRNADICNNAEKAGDYTPVLSWYGGFTPSPQNK